MAGLIFGDQGNTYNWTLDNNNSSSNTLNLGNPLSNPLIYTPQQTISVNNGTTTISAVITGSLGLVVNPSGGTGTLVLSGNNTFYNSPAQGIGINGGYGAITIDGGVLSIASDCGPTTLTAATPSPLGYLPPGGSLPFPSSGATYNPDDIIINGGTLQATATFQLNSWRGVALGSPNGGGGGSINVASGQVLTYGYDDIPNPGFSDVIISGFISDYNTGSSLTLTGGGTLFLTSSNIYTGATNINGGIHAASGNRQCDFAVF